jgi:hypothetical protein
VPFFLWETKMSAKQKTEVLQGTLALMVRARFYSLTVAERKQLQAEARDWNQAAAIIAGFFAVKAEDFS